MNRNYQNKFGEIIYAGHKENTLILKLWLIFSLHFSITAL